MTMAMLRSKSTLKGNLPQSVNNSGLDPSAKTLLNSYSTLNNNVSTAAMVTSLTTVNNKISEVAGQVSNLCNRIFLTYGDHLKKRYKVTVTKKNDAGVN